MSALRLTSTCERIFLPHASRRAISPRLFRPGRGRRRAALSNLAQLAQHWRAILGGHLHQQLYEQRLFIRYFNCTALRLHISSQISLFLSPSLLRCCAAWSVCQVSNKEGLSL